MELDFSPDQDELREAIRTVLVKEAPVTLARSVVETGARPTALWDTFVALGWAGLTIAEAHGGVGLGPIEAAILAEELGRVIAPGPLLRPSPSSSPRCRSAAPTSSARAGSARSPSTGSPAAWRSAKPAARSTRPTPP